MIKIRFYSLSGKFAFVKEETFKDTTEALKAVKAYAEPEGYTNFKLIDTDDDGGVRFTGNPPVGKPGRNIAMGDYDDVDDEY